MHQVQLHLSLFCCTFFKPFPGKSKKGSRVRPQSLKTPPKWTARAPKRSPKNNKPSPKVPPSTKIMQKRPPRLAQWSPKYGNGVPGRPKMQEKHKKVSQSANQARKCAARCRKTHKHTYTQTTNQPANQPRK